MTHNPAIDILLTRPATLSAEYAIKLMADFKGAVRIVQSPLLEILPVETVLDFAGVHHLLFTSVNGVDAFAQRTEQRNIPALCVGERTKLAARACGLKAIAANGNAESLLALAASSATGQSGDFLYLRGKMTASDIAGDLADAGYPTRELVIYEQRALPLNAIGFQILQNHSKTIVPLFSPRTADLFAKEVADYSVNNIDIICLSQNVANNLGAALTKYAIVVDHPTADAVTREIAASL